jgi:hypothetical protein
MRQLIKFSFIGKNPFELNLLKGDYHLKKLTKKMTVLVYKKL